MSPGPAREATATAQLQSAPPGPGGALWPGVMCADSGHWGTKAWPPLTNQDALKPLWVGPPHSSTSPSLLSPPTLVTPRAQTKDPLLTQQLRVHFLQTLWPAGAVRSWDTALFTCYAWVRYYLTLSPFLLYKNKTDLYFIGETMGAQRG